MENPGWARRVALCVGGLAIVGMGLTGCSATQESPSPTGDSPTSNSVDTKRGGDDNDDDNGRGGDTPREYDRDRLGNPPFFNTGAPPAPPAPPLPPSPDYGGTNDKGCDDKDCGR